MQRQDPSHGSGLMLSKSPTKAPTKLPSQAPSKAPTKAPAGPDRALLARFAAIVGDKHAITDREAHAPYLIEMRDMFHGRTPMVLRPGSVAEVAQILRLANETATAIVPQG